MLGDQPLKRSSTCRLERGMCVRHRMLVARGAQRERTAVALRSTGRCLTPGDDVGAQRRRWNSCGTPLAKVSRSSKSMFWSFIGGHPRVPL
jgi:hypothetical protein